MMKTEKQYLVAMNPKLFRVTTDVRLVTFTPTMLVISKKLCDYGKDSKITKLSALLLVKSVAPEFKINFFEMKSVKKRFGLGDFCNYIDIIFVHKNVEQRISIVPLNKNHSVIRSAVMGDNLIDYHSIEPLFERLRNAFEKAN